VDDEDGSITDVKEIRFIKTAVEGEKIIGGEDDGNPDPCYQDISVMIRDLEYEPENGNQQCCNYVENPQVLQFNAANAFFKIGIHDS